MDFNISKLFFLTSEKAFKSIFRFGEEISEFDLSRPFFVKIQFEVLEDDASVGFSLVFSDNEGIELFASLSNSEPRYYNKKLKKGAYEAYCEVFGDLFNNIDIVISLICFASQWTDSFIIENALKINGVDDGILKADYFGNYGGFLRPKFNWLTEMKHEY